MHGGPLHCQVRPQGAEVESVQHRHTALQRNPLQGAAHRTDTDTQILLRRVV